MTAAATFELDPVTVALQAWLADAVLTGADGEAVFPVGDSAAPLDDTDGQPVDPPYGVLYQLPGVRHVPPYAGAVHVTGRWQVTTVADTPSLARHWADRVRKAVAGEDGDGAQVAMVLPDSGVLVIGRRGMDDGTIDLVGQLWQWAETFELDLVPGEPPEGP